MKGIIIANKIRETSLFPLNIQLSKYFMPIYDKPMIYYPLSLLMSAGINDVLIITANEEIETYMSLFGNGDRLGISISYSINDSTDIREIIIDHAEFIGQECVAVVEGDMILTGPGLKEKLSEAVDRAENGITTLFSCYIETPNHYDVHVFNDDGIIKLINEQSLQSESSNCLVGMIFYDYNMVSCIKMLDVVNNYICSLIDLYSICLKKNELYVDFLDYEYYCITISNPDILHDTTMYIWQQEKYQHRKIACIEEISLFNGWISFQEVDDMSSAYLNIQYGEYLQNLVRGKYLSE